MTILKDWMKEVRQSVDVNDQESDSGEDDGDFKQRSEAVSPRSDRMRKYDKNRHALTHYKGTMVCPFCPGPGTAYEKSFNRADVFKRHLTAVHNVEQTPPNSPQDFYEHLDDCVLNVIVPSTTPRSATSTTCPTSGAMSNTSSAVPSSAATSAATSVGQDSALLRTPTTAGSAQEQDLDFQYHLRRGAESGATSDDNRDKGARGDDIDAAATSPQALPAQYQASTPTEPPEQRDEHVDKMESDAPRSSRRSTPQSEKLDDMGSTTEDRPRVLAVEVKLGSPFSPDQA
ncbi:hypothetical protein SLS64_004361 [Diaporthe eres]|uniref:Uncharacterized protein n=1 Tax=Diaporthe eres TaxID=83184 RepID=A0ABR1PLJ9_DIAER